jgi:arylsulfatase A
MGWGDLAVNGNRFVHTPVIDKLANQSLSFDRFYVCPLSAPTRSEMLTGRYFLRTGVSSVTQGLENMRTDETTIAEALKQKGYSTGCFGKWHNGGYYLQHPNRQGFDEYVGFCMGHLGYYYDMNFIHNDTLIKSTGYTTDFFTDKALEFIEGHKDKPFFCYVPYNVPHSPFQVPEKYFSKYISSGLDSTLSSVYGMVENMDDNIGKILKKIDELNLGSNTIVIFLSDNGPNTWRFNGDMKGKKGDVDEGGIRTPFYIRWPGKIRPGTTDQLGQSIDIFPTLIGLCGISHSYTKPIDGIDLSDVITGQKSSVERYIFSRQAYENISNCGASVRDIRYRFVRTKAGTFLYDMIADPGQKNDISSSEKEKAATLSSLLSKWESELVDNYEPVTTIHEGFSNEKSFTLPVQDALLSKNLKYSSIYPNQAYTLGWSSTEDSIFWNLNIEVAGSYSAELQYGCPKGKTGSEFKLSSSEGGVSFAVKDVFESEILPERDYVKRGESVERTWAWMNAGSVNLASGNERIVLKMVKPAAKDAVIIKAIRLTATANSY